MATLRGDRGETFAAAVGRWTRRTDARLAAVVREAAFDLAEAVSVGNAWGTGTPVDTGYARNNWVASLGAPSDATPAGAAPPTRPAGGTGALVPDVALPAMQAVIAGVRAGQVLYLTNNTAYLAYLEYGLTVPAASDTPPGWIAAATRQWPAIVAAAIRRVRGAVGRGVRV